MYDMLSLFLGVSLITYPIGFYLMKVNHCRQTSAEAKPLDLPPPAGADKVFSPKITSLVQDISNLSLLEVADLNECLKVKDYSEP
jgi:hypothetical protein